ncbi:microfibril-associated glycoprotein 4-like [Palaemon carinicauda]|uniref:microfibril-associated glycoprotein 4-like n=1 Tax=Palaemon carinicauda TaxID=392227 RepID=UPI0035B59872
MVTVWIYASCFLLCVLNDIARVNGDTSAPDAGNQNVYYTLPLELVERLMAKQDVPVDKSSSCTYRDSQNSDAFTKLLVLLIEKLDKEQTRLEQQVTSLAGSLKQNLALKTEMECGPTPREAETKLESLLQRLEVISSGLMTHPEFESPTQPRDSSSKNCRGSPDRPKDCYELYQQGKNKSGVYTIYPHKCHRAEEGVRVWCDQEDNGGGWTVVLSRRPLDDQVNFNRGWQDYKTGFGEAETEYWIGNDALHAITSSGRQMLRVEMEDWDGNKRFVEHNSFLVEGEDSNYRLHLGKHSGTGGDAFLYHDNMAFSTSDRDNDLNSGSNCAAEFGGGFWYNSCHYVSPTSFLLKKQRSESGITWRSWYIHRETLKEMYFKVKEYPCM